MVDIRANKADSNGPALVGGLVYRVKEDCITVAVEEAPDEGLDQPLRLEKLANEVCTCDRLMTYTICTVHVHKGQVEGVLNIHPAASTPAENKSQGVLPCHKMNGAC